MTAKKRKLGQAITWRYIAALTLIACLSTGAFVALYYTIAAEEKRGSVVRLVAQQQAATQRIAFFANAYASATSGLDQEHYRRELGRSIGQFSRTHDILVHGQDSFEIPEHIVERLNTLFHAGDGLFERQVKQFLAHAESIQASDVTSIEKNDARLLSLNLAGMNYLPQGYDLISGILEDDGERNIHFLENLEIAIWFATLALLILEALLIFRPLANRVRHAVQDLESAQEAAVSAAMDAEKTRRRLWSSIDTLGDGFAIYDKDDRLVIANAAYKSTQDPIAGLIEPGVPFQELLEAGLEKNVWDLEGAERDKWVKQRLEARSGGAGLEIEKKLVDGRIVVCRERRTENDEIVEVHFDVTTARRRERELSHAKTELERMAYHDDLTGLGNRAACERDLSNRLQNAGPDDALVVIHFDIDHFKKVNDRMGHRTGDRLLKEVGRRISILSEELPDAEAFRWGGDEFVFVCSRDESLDLNALCRDINDVLSIPLAIEDVTVWPSASVGVARYPEDGTDLDSLIAFADLALYEAKEKGRDNYHFFTRELKDRVENQKTIEGELHKAVINRSLELFFQPQVSVETNAVTGIECLLRWRHPERGLLAPGVFLDVAEQSNLAIDIGRYVIDSACSAARRWHALGLDYGHVAINISPKHLSLTSFADDFIAALDRHGLDAKSVAIEVVESVFIDDTRNSHTMTLNRLYSKGIAVELDDFGTGFASLSHLTMLPVSGIKIDKAFTDGLVNKSRKSDVVRAIVNLGKLLEMRVVCEGVEFNEQLESLSQFADVHAQGYLIARPMPFEEMTAWLNEHRPNAELPKPGTEFAADAHSAAVSQ